MLRYKYIGLIGLPGSGKDLAARILHEELGFICIRMSEELSTRLKEMGVNPTRDRLREFGTKLRKERGAHAVAEMVLERIRGMEKEVNPPGFVINGIRNVEEIDFFREKLGPLFLSLAIYAPRNLRYVRLLKRGRKGFDKRTYEEFLIEDRREVEIFNLGNAIILADKLIVNDRDRENLRYALLRAILDL